MDNETSEVKQGQEVINKNDVETVENLTEEKQQEQEQQQEETQQEQATESEKGMVAMEEFNIFKDELTKKLASLEQQFAQSNAQVDARVEERVKDINLQNEINAFLGGKPFVNSFTKDAIQQKLTTEVKNVTHQGKTIEQIYDEMTANLDGLYINQNKVTIESAGNCEQENTAVANFAQLFGQR